ncbi:helix-turn-helix domain-containing protein, partial [[Clostridium] innocuum]|nr:helix-turn-helix domain-containing protein [[Clostridium] innocuum]
SMILQYSIIAQPKQKREMIQQASISNSNKLLLHYRYDLSMKQEEIARKLNISQVQVSRLEKKIIKKLKERLAVA